MTQTVVFDDVVLLGGPLFYVNRPRSYIPYNPDFGGTSAPKPMVGGRVIYLAPDGSFKALPEATP